MNNIIYIAIVLVVLWLVLRLALALTSGLLHLLWIAALVMLAIWLWNKFTGRKGTD